MKKKILAILVTAALLGFFVPTVLGGNTVTITGFFTPSVTVSIVCNVSTLEFGTIALGENSTITRLNVSNYGTTNCSVTTIAQNNATDNWTIKDSVLHPTEANNFSVIVIGYIDTGDLLVNTSIYSSQTLIADLNVTGAKNTTEYNITLCLGTTSTSGPGVHQLYANLTASPVT